MAQHAIFPVYILMDGLTRGGERATGCRWAEFEDCYDLIGCRVQFPVLVGIARSDQA
jgi:hypothetical protein